MQSDYQRRSDLIPNLVNTVKGAANFEQTTLTNVIEARAKATQVQINANDLTPENLAKFQQAQAGLTGALGKLLAVAEAYPGFEGDAEFQGLAGSAFRKEPKTGSKFPEMILTLLCRTITRL